MYLEYYLKQLDDSLIPEFLKKYLHIPSLERLKHISYFCGMDYASKDIYNFREYISRYDHSLTVALLTYKLTNDPKATIAGLIHDVATPCFSHVIDYMNKDYAKQESTEKYTEEILRKDKKFLECLKEDKIELEDIIDFKKYTIVDNERPKMCADRIDGVILTAISWTKDITKKDIKEIVKDLYVVENEVGEKEIAFHSPCLAQKVVTMSTRIDKYCHSKEDNYMMELLANITRMAINKKIISDSDLYSKTEEELFIIFENSLDEELKELVRKFQTIKRKEVPDISLPPIKKRELKPLINKQRLEMKNRCSWTNPTNEVYLKYHDTEWGVPTYDDRMLLELLILESFQAGLSWECILNKRENFRKAYDNFALEEIIKYDEEKQKKLEQNQGIIRNKLKIKASINNAKIFKNIQKEYGSFSDYIWHFTKNKIIYELDKTTSPLSDTISEDLTKRGMKFVGSTIIYSYLQAIGVIYSHSKDCFLYKNKK